MSTTQSNSVHHIVYSYFPLTWASCEVLYRSKIAPFSAKTYWIIHTSMTSRRPRPGSDNVPHPTSCQRACLQLHMNIIIPDPDLTQFKINQSIYHRHSATTESLCTSMWPWWSISLEPASVLRNKLYEAVMSIQLSSLRSGAILPWEEISYFYACISSLVSAARSILLYMAVIKLLPSSSISSAKY